ncbi:MAG: hypothetical protein HQL91_03680 [Magnetococcales bacterium]|nr:hypothetical protein [Magnetococcales bacterium]
MNTSRLLLLLTLLLCSPRLHADGVLKPVHGGRMVEADGYRLELVSGNGPLELYVTDHDNRPVAVKNAKAKVTWMGETGKKELSLIPTEGNRLTGDGADGGQRAAVIAIDGLAKRITARVPSGKP